MSLIQNLLSGLSFLKEGEKSLRKKIERSRSELLSVFDGIDDPMVMIDKNFRIRRINEAMLKTMDASSYQSFIGKACYWKLHGLRDVCPDCPSRKVFAGGMKSERIGILGRRSEPDQFTYQITAYPLKDTSGSVTGIAEAYRDVTAIRRTEEELYESERARVMEPLAAGIAHEVRNPLAIIQSTAQFCLSEIDPNHQELREGFETILRNTEQANRVITNLLDFARPRETDFKRQALAPLIRKTIDLIRTRASAQKVRVVFRPARMPPLILDGNRLIQALMNLVVNSLDAMPDGGSLEVTAHLKKNSGRHAIVVIRDSGEGIPVELLPKVLQPFYSTKKHGIGLGLPIAEGLIRSHGGRLRFKSCKGEGTEVTIELPVESKNRRKVG